MPDITVTSPPHEGEPEGPQTIERSDTAQSYVGYEVRRFWFLPCIIFGLRTGDRRGTA